MTLRLVGVAIAIAGATTAQQSPPQPPPFRVLRYDEDYRYLADPARRVDALDRLKYVPLGDDPDSFVSFGGEARTRYEYFDAPGFGLRGVAHDDFVLQRFLLHADVHTGERTGWHGRAFVQLLAGFVGGEELPKSAVQDNQLDLQQGFVDVAAGTTATLRVGRQELLLGSARLVTPRDPTNARLTFDAARGMVELGEHHLDLLLARPVRPDTETFDDDQDDQQLLWGLYSTHVLAPKGRLGLDVYLLGLEREAVRFDRQRGDEVRHSVGLRLAGRDGGFDHDTEAVFQFGTYDVAGRARQEIRAWTLASHTGYTFADVGWQPRLGFKCNVASGDRDPGDGQLETFDPLYPRLNYFSDAALFAPSNFFDVHPSLRLQLAADLVFTLTSDLFFRQSRDDAVYGPNGPVLFGDGSGSRFVGSTTSVMLEWRLSRRVDWTCNFVHFARGDVVQDNGGGDVEFFASWLTLRL